MMDATFDFVGKDNDGLGYGFDRSTNLWVHGRDILHDIFGNKSLHEEFKINFCNEIFEFLHQHGGIGIDVAFTSGNNSFGADLEFTREIEFEKHFVLEDLKSFVGSVVEEDSSNVKNSLLSLSGGRAVLQGGRVIDEGKTGRQQGAPGRQSTLKGLEVFWVKYGGGNSDLVEGSLCRAARDSARRHNGFPSDILLVVVNDICVLASTERTASCDGTIHVWNSQSGKNISVTTEHAENYRQYGSSLIFV
nr:protein GFS12 isoform X2 [Tanacetum cinerariifolium]